MPAEVATCLQEASLPPGLRTAAALFEVFGPCGFREGGDDWKVSEAGHLNATLSRRIYERCHLHALPQESNRQIDERHDIPQGLANILTRLMDCTYLEPGWRISGWRDDRVVVERDRLHVLAQPDEIAVSGLSPKIGASASLRLPVLRPVAQPGFLVAFSPHGPPPGESLWRLYLHPRERHAEDAFLTMFDRLSLSGLSFQAKVLRRRSLFVRPDALVVFLARRDVPAGAAVAHGLPDEWLADSSPGFARRIGRGRAVAPEPDGERSYGQQAAAWAADGLIAAWRAGASDAEDRFRVMLAQVSQPPWETAS